jgi:hypothetical protein
VNFWKYLRTAGREGSGDVRTIVFLSEVLIAGLILLSILFWYIFKRWFFGDFSPANYWNMTGNFWNTLISIWWPVIIGSFVLGQLAGWLSDGNGFIASENVFFKSWLSLEAQREIVGLETEKASKWVKDDAGFNLRVSDAVKELILKIGFSKVFGARNLQRAIRDLLLNPLGRESTRFEKNSTILADLDNGAVVFREQQAEPAEPQQ